MMEQREQLEATAAEDRVDVAASHRFKLIEQAIEDLRPYLRADGGDCELVGVEGDLVKVRLKGACVGCQLSHVTINGVQERLIAKIGRPLRIIPVKGAH